MPVKNNFVWNTASIIIKINNQSVKHRPIVAAIYLLQNNEALFCAEVSGLKRKYAFLTTEGAGSDVNCLYLHAEGAGSDVNCLYLHAERAGSDVNCLYLYAERAGLDVNHPYLHLYLCVFYQFLRFLSILTQNFDWNH